MADKNRLRLEWKLERQEYEVLRAGTFCLECWRHEPSGALMIVCEQAGACGRRTVERDFYYRGRRYRSEKKLVEALYGNPNPVQPSILEVING